MADTQTYRAINTILLVNHALQQRGGHTQASAACTDNKDTLVLQCQSFTLRTNGSNDAWQARA